MTSEPLHLPGWANAREMRTCWHEAGHAVAARHLVRRRLVRATVVPGRNADGKPFRGKVSSRPSHLRNVAQNLIADHDVLNIVHPELLDNTRAFAFTRITIAVAGVVAERLFLDLDTRLSGSDKTKAESHAALICRTSTGIRRLLQAAESEAEAILDEHRHVVRALAIALREHRTLSGRRIDHVIAKALADHEALLRSPAGEALVRMRERQRLAGF
jgi:hypothetical protein